MIPFDCEKELKIKYKGLELQKKYYADFVCFGKIILEIKALTALCNEHKAQLINYLKATGFRLGILINFGETSLVYHRLVL